MWTYITLIIDFINKITQKSKEREQVIKEVFAENENLDYFIAAENEEAMMKKLMKRYERVELQYDVDDARKELTSGYDKIMQMKIEISEDYSKSKLFSESKNRSQDEHAIQ
jgi:hypothetical protein